jgi:hypothetical protein
MSPVPRSNDPRNYPRPGAVGGDRASAMARPALATAVPGTNQRSQVVATGATSGTFTLHVQGRSGDLDLTTAAINWNDSQAALVAKLNGVLTAVGLSASGVSGGPLPAATMVEFAGGETMTLTVTNNTLVGGTAVVSTTQAATGYVAAMPAKNGRGFRGSSPSAMAHPKPLGQGRR